MGCGPSKTLRVSRNASFSDDNSSASFGGKGEEVSALVCRLSKDLPLQGLNNGDIACNRSPGGGGKARVGQKAVPAGSKMGTGPLVTPLQRTPSQIEFFKKLDEKIDKGPDLTECPEEAWPEEEGPKRPS